MAVFGKEKGEDMNEIQTKRVAVAKDALMQARSGICEGVSGLYVFQKNWNSACQVCALGGLLLGAVSQGLCPDVLMQSATSVRWVSGRESIEDALSAFWTSAELGDIESAFEVPGDWLRYFESDTDRLIAILQNIVRHNGSFDPADIRPIEPDAPTINSIDFHHEHRVQPFDTRAAETAAEDRR